MGYILSKLSLGIVILLLSSKSMVDFAKKLSIALTISPLIIGTTVVAIGTSLPELSVSAIASIKQDAGLALGNIIGSNIINVFLVFSAAILVGKLRIGTTKTQRNAFIMLGITLFYVGLNYLPISHYFSGVLLITLAVVFTIMEFEWGLVGRMHEDIKILKKKKKPKFGFIQILGLLFSIAGVVIGGWIIVSSTEQISQITGYSTTVLGLSLTAIATSLPELLTTLFSQEEDQEKLTAGNIIGSNIYNILLIGGIVMLSSPIISIPIVDFVILAFATFCLFIILRHYKGKFVPKWVGFMLLMLFVSYILFLKEKV